MTVAVVYPFFAHYRRALLDRLRSHTNDTYIFVADVVNRLMPGVPTWRPDSDDAFIKARSWPLAGGIILQPRIVPLALRRDLDAIIYLGDWKWPTTWLSAILARISGKTVLLWTHGWRTPDRGIKRFIRSSFYSIGHGLLLYGNRAREIAVKQGFNPARMYVVFNSICHDAPSSPSDNPRFEDEAQIRREIFGRDDVPVAICSARLIQNKRLDLLIRAASELKAQGTPLNVIIIGDGPERKALENSARDFGVDVHFAGELYNEPSISRLMTAADLTVIPGAAGLTVIQSMRYGVPVIANNNWAIQGPEVEAVIEGRTGAFFSDGSLESLVASIRRYISLSEVQKNTMRNSCRHIVERFYNPAYQELVISNAIRLIDAEYHRPADALDSVQ